ncbi:hypothetical protein J4Q44_G00309260 [Coregonus suidteri]|uniref:Uncharacterized protein n=1 Tax=Coregonus suidteri TaxID=861788 RepID=A0AAN8L4U6_9TELE
MSFILTYRASAVTTIHTSDHRPDRRRPLRLRQKQTEPLQQQGFGQITQGDSGSSSLTHFSLHPVRTGLFSRQTEGEGRKRASGEQHHPTAPPHSTTPQHHPTAPPTQHHPTAPPHSTTPQHHPHSTTPQHHPHSTTHTAPPHSTTHTAPPHPTPQHSTTPPQHHPTPHHTTAPPHPTP